MQLARQSPQVQLLYRTDTVMAKALSGTHQRKAHECIGEQLLCGQTNDDAASTTCKRCHTTMYQGLLTVISSQQ